MNAGAEADLLPFWTSEPSATNWIDLQENSDETLQPVLRWLDEHVNLQADPEEVHA